MPAEPSSAPSPRRDGLAPAGRLACLLPARPRRPSPVPEASPLMKVLRATVVTAAVLIPGVLVVAPPPRGLSHVERPATMNAAPATVFATINDLHQWSEWSPWARLDPTMKVTYSGPASGVNAGYAWVGNDKVGAGNMTITESTPEAHIGMRLEVL